MVTNVQFLMTVRHKSDPDSYRGAPEGAMMQEQRLNYIHENPVRIGFVYKAEVRQRVYKNNIAQW